jgi:hypothetical protein
MYTPGCLILEFLLKLCETKHSLSISFINLIECVVERPFVIIGAEAKNEANPEEMTADRWRERFLMTYFLQLDPALPETILCS